MPETRLSKTDVLKYQKQISVLMAVIPFTFIAGLVAGYLFWGRQSPTQPVSAANVEVTSTPDMTRYEVSADDDPFLGSQNAPVTIIEFSDYQCPFCTKWKNEVWPRLQKTYGDKIRLVYRDFPLANIHSEAAQAAEAANCANEQNAYWQFHDKLFDASRGLGLSAYREYARELKLDLAAFDECLSSQRYQDEVQADFEYAAKLGVRSTPTFFINGIAVIGAQPFEVFKQVIDKELAGE